MFCGLAHLATAQTIPDARTSGYSERLSQLLARWMPVREATAPVTSVELTCIGTVGDDAYIGILRRMSIRASLPEVEGVLDDIDVAATTVPMHRA